MIPEFGSWYRAVSIEPNDDLLRKRWAGVVKAAEECDANGALELARLFNGHLAISPAWQSEFSNWFREEDAAFDSGSRTAEMVVLAGSTIAQLIATDDEIGNIAAMATQIAAFGIGDERMRLPSIRVSVAEYLTAQATKARQPPSHRPMLKDRKKKIDATCAALQQGHQQASDPLKVILLDLASGIDELDKSLSLSERIRQESSGVLWWTTAGFSETLNVPFATAAAEMLPFVCAFELAGLTQLSPWLPNDRAFLSRALGGRLSEAKPLIEWIRPVERQVRHGMKQNLKQAKPQPTLPVLQAIGRSLELANDDVWAADWAARHGDAAADVSPVAFAAQLYREIVLTNAMSQQS